MENKRINKDEELAEYLLELETRPGLKMHFSLAEGATKADVEESVKIVEDFLSKK